MSRLPAPPSELVSFLEGLTEPHILLDDRHHILAANGAYRRQFGVAGCVVGLTCHAVSHHVSVPCDQAGESCPLAQARASGQRERVLHVHHTAQGEEYVQIELAPVAGADGTGCAATGKGTIFSTKNPVAPSAPATGASSICTYSSPWAVWCTCSTRSRCPEARACASGQDSPAWSQGTLAWWDTAWQVRPTTLPAAPPSVPPAAPNWRR